MPKPRRVTLQCEHSSQVSHEQLAALGYAAFAAQLCTHTPLGFDALPARVQAGWVAAVATIRQRVLEDKHNA